MAQANESGGLRAEIEYHQQAMNRHTDDTVPLASALAMAAALVVFSPVLVPVVAYQHLRARREIATARNF